MAKILNKIAGYQGYTISGPGDTDVKGYVDYVFQMWILKFLQMLMHSVR